MGSEVYKKGETLFREGRVTKIFFLTIYSVLIITTEFKALIFVIYLIWLHSHLHIIEGAARRAVYY